MRMWSTSCSFRRKISSQTLERYRLVFYFILVKCGTQSKVIRLSAAVYFLKCRNWKNLKWIFRWQIEFGCLWSFSMSNNWPDLCIPWDNWNANFETIRLCLPQDKSSRFLSSFGTDWNYYKTTGQVPRTKVGFKILSENFVFCSLALVCGRSYEPIKFILWNAAG